MTEQPTLPEAMVCGRRICSEAGDLQLTVTLPNNRFWRRCENARNRPTQHSRNRIAIYECLSAISLGGK